MSASNTVNVSHIRAYETECIVVHKFKAADACKELGAIAKKVLPTMRQRIKLNQRFTSCAFEAAIGLNKATEVLSAFDLTGTPDELKARVGECAIPELVALIQEELILNQQLNVNPAK